MRIASGNGWSIAASVENRISTADSTIFATSSRKKVKARR
jgi:hypothetical protein